MNDLNRRIWRRVRLVSVAVLVVAATACGSSDDTSTTAAESDGAFPVTIEHLYGETTIEKAPERIVSLGYTDHDTLLQLGIEPIGVRDWYGIFDKATGPWAADLWSADADPEVFGKDEINAEAVAALHPDLILAVNPGLEEDEYTALAKIAPVVTHPAAYKNYNTPWAEQVATIGKAVGKVDEAKAIVDEHQARLAQVPIDHPEFVGKSATIACFYGQDPCAYVSQDATNRFLTDIGFDHPDSIDQHAGTSDYAEYSAENMDQLDLDVTVWLVGTSGPDARRLIEGLPLYKTMRLQTEGRSVFIEENAQALDNAISVSSPLSQRYLIDKFVPMLAAAVDGNPATSVPAFTLN